VRRSGGWDQGGRPRTHAYGATILQKVAFERFKSAAALFYVCFSQDTAALDSQCATGALTERQRSARRALQALCGAQLCECGLVELGATWLHGVVGHPVYEAALRLGYMDGTERERASAPPPVCCVRSGRARWPPWQAVRALSKHLRLCRLLGPYAPHSLLGTQRPASARLPATLGLKAATSWALSGTTPVRWQPLINGIQPGVTASASATLARACRQCGC